MKRISGETGGHAAPTRSARVPKNPVKLALIGVGVAVLAMTVVATPAGASSKPATPPTTQPSGAVPPGFSSWNQLWTYQARLNAAAEQILAAGEAGNPSIVADPTSHQLRVYWHGTIPATVRAAAGRSGVPVTFRPAAFTHRKLVTAARQIAGTAPVLSAAPARDGSGLAVTVDGALTPAARSSLRIRSRIPLSITAGTRPRATSTRQADIPAFWGGTRYLTVNGQCTNGIPVKLNGAAYMMTAGHCSPLGTSVTIPGQPGPTGFTSNVNTCRDTALINYPAGIAPTIYTGPFDAAGNEFANIGGATPDFVGNMIVTGGASSGEHFGIQVTKVDDFEPSIGGISCNGPLGPLPVGPLTVAFSVTNTCAQAPGDSGGPVYSYVGNTAFVRGTITGGNSGVPCPGTVPTGGFQVFYAPLVRPVGDPQIGSLGYYGAVVLGVPAFNLNGTYNDGFGRPPGPVISVQGQAISVDMSRFHRPTAHGTFIDETHISVTFPDDRTYTGVLNPGSRAILWSNNSIWYQL
jgi:hypothetical protein